MKMQEKDLSIESKKLLDEIVKAINFEAKDNPFAELISKLDNIPYTREQAFDLANKSIKEFLKH
jgi:hypothetical protein